MVQIYTAISDNKNNKKVMNIDLLSIIDADCQNTIRACIYYEALDGTDLVQLKFIRNSLANVAISSWCKTFGANSERSHFSHLFNQCKNNSVQNNKANTQKRIRNSVAMNDSDYKLFWEAVKKARDQFFAHNDHNELIRPIMPDLVLLKKSAIEMRIIIQDLAKDFYLLSDLLEQVDIKTYTDQLEREAQNLRTLVKL